MLIQINIGDEQTKSGFELSQAEEVYAQLKAMPSLKVKGLMAMLPDSDDTQLLKTLATKMRRLFEELKAKDEDIEYLSMGMSGDWRLCVDCGSNMIRLGTAIFGARSYQNRPTGN